MKKLSVIAVVVLIFAFSVSSFASETRVSTMGGVGFFFRDNSNISYFPGLVNTYSNLVITELRSYGESNYTIGALLPFNSLTIGAYLNDPLLYSFSGNYVEIDHGTTLLLGSKMGGSNLGLALTVAMDNYTDEYLSNDKIEEETESAHFFGLSAGLSNDQFDGGFHLHFPGSKYEMGDVERKWGGFSLLAIGRAFIPQSEQLELVPVGAFFLGSMKQEYDGTFSDSETKYNDLTISLGVGLNYQLDEKNLVVLGLEAFTYDKETEDVKDGTESTESEITLPGLYLGLESHVSSWFIARVGASQVCVIESESTKPDGGKETTTSARDSRFGFSLGFGIKFGSFLFDASFNEGMFFDGPYFLSGETNRLANRLSLSYVF